MSPPMRPGRTKPGSEKEAAAASRRQAPPDGRRGRRVGSLWTRTALRRSRADVLAFVLAAVCALVLVAGCGDGVDRREKASASALWISPQSAPLDASDSARLQAAGIEEAFVEAGTFDPSADPPLRRAEELPESVGLPTHLVVGGTWATSDGEEAAALGAATAEAARQLRFDLESAGWLVTGLVLDLDGFGASAERAEAYGAFLRAAHGALEELHLGATAPRGAVLAATEAGDDGEAAKDRLGEVASGVDFLVPLLYGQRSDEPEDPDAWDFGRVEAGLLAVEDLGVPYLLGVGTVGTASHVDSDDRFLKRTTEMTMADLVEDRAMRLRPSITLEGGDRRVYTLDAEERARVDGWELEAGEAVRVVRTATYDMEELTRLLDTWPLEHYLGQVYYRLRGEREGLSLGVASLVNARDDDPATPELVLDVAVQRRSGRGWLLRFAVENLSQEFTELAFSSYNYVEITTEFGRFATEQRTGDFYRYELYRQEDGELRRTIRGADVLRLYIPMVEAEQRVSSGDVLLNAREISLRIEGRFLLPDGRTYEIGPAFYRDGELTGDDVKG